MTDHDPMCSEAVSLPYSGMAYHCDCALIARVRADERERWASDTPITDFTRLAAQRNAELAHAEAVADRLHMTPASLEKHLYRWKRPDLLPPRLADIRKTPYR